MNALFLSLWWFYKGCREASDQMATTYFAASMDALAGGDGAESIEKMIGALIGFQPNEALMKDGTTTRRVVTEVYRRGRSNLIHGSSKDFAHDWSQVRSKGETLGRLCLVFACDWMSKNPEADDLGGLLKS